MAESSLKVCAFIFSLFMLTPPTSSIAEHFDSVFIPFDEPSAKSPLKTAPPLIWEKLFDNNENADGALDIIETPEGDFVMVGSTGPTPCIFGCNWDGLVIKIDSLGNLKWARQFGGSGADLLTSVTLKGEHYVVVGSKSESSLLKAWFLELASDGSVAREKTFGGDKDDSASAIIAIDDGGFLMLGQTKSFGTNDGKSDVWLVKLNSVGDIVWMQTYNLGYEDIGGSIAPFQDDRFIISAVSCTAQCGNLLQQGFASYLVVDSDGNVLKTETFADGPKNKLGKINPTSDGGAIIVGATSVEEVFPSEDTWIVKLDSNADVSWMKIIQDENDNGRIYDGAHDAIQTSDGGYIVTAYTQISPDPDMDYDNFWLIRLDSDGNILQTYLWGGPDNDDVYSIISTSDGKFVTAGFLDGVSWPPQEMPGPADVYVIKFTDPESSDDDTDDDVDDDIDDDVDDDIDDDADDDTNDNDSGHHRADDNDNGCGCGIS